MARLVRRFAAASLLVAAMHSLCAAADAPAVAPGAAPAPTPARKSIEKADRDRLVPLLKGYLNPDDENAYKAGVAMIKEIGALRQTGVDLLADHDALMSLVYPARPFAPYFDKPLIPRAEKESYATFDSGTGVVAVKWGEIRLSLSHPAGYFDAQKSKKLSALQPYPMLVVLHELQPDFEDPKTKEKKKDPGSEAIKRLWDRKASKIPDSWFVFAPVAPRAEFVSETGQARVSRVPLAEIYTRYQVDFDHFVLDGSTAALAFAVSQPNFYAGLIVRARGKLDLPCPDLIGNLSPLQIFVDGPADAPVVAALKGKVPDAQVTVGGPDALPEWLGKVAAGHHRPPTDFQWTVKDKDAQNFAHWINLDSIDHESATLDVQVTKEDNTVRITSNGVRQVSLFLSDQIVDLAREVNVVVNGAPVKEVNVPAKSPQGRMVKLPAKFEGNLYDTFDDTQISAKKTMYYPWVWPVRMRRIAIKGDVPRGTEPATCPAPTTNPGAGPAAGGLAKEPDDDAPMPGKPADDATAEQQEKEAKNYFDKAEAKLKEAAEAKDDKLRETALKLYRKAMKAGWSSVYKAAQDQVHDLTK